MASPFALVPYAAQRWSKEGQARAKQEKKAAGDLTTPGAFDMSGAEKRAVTGELIRAQEEGAGGFREQEELLRRNFAASSPVLSGLATKQFGEIQKARAIGRGAAGLSVAELSTEEARRKRALAQGLVDAKLARIGDMFRNMMPGAGTPGLTGVGGETEAVKTAGEGEDAGEDAGKAAPGENSELLKTGAATVWGGPAAGAAAGGTGTPV
jgi:hypothetical protein